MASAPSTSRISTPSIQPPWNPATPPTSAPSRMARATARAETVSEIRPPDTTRARISRLSWSVPKGCPAPGARAPASRSGMAFGSGRSRGPDDNERGEQAEDQQAEPSRAAAQRCARAGARAIRSCAAHARIEGVVPEVGQQPAEEDQRRHQHGGAEDDGVVPGPDGIGGERAESGPVEHLLDEHRAGHQDREPEAEQPQDRKERVAPGVPPDAPAAPRGPGRGRRARSRAGAPRARRSAGSA